VRPFNPSSQSPATAASPLWMVSSNGGVFPRWSADGKRLFYMSVNSDLMAMDVHAGASFQTGVPQRLFSALVPGLWSVSPSGDRFLLVRPNTSPGPPPPFTMVLNWMSKLEQ